MVAASLAASPGAAGDAGRGRIRSGASNRLDMTGQRPARQVTSSPAQAIAAAPASASRCQGRAVMTTCAENPATGGAPPPCAPPAVTEPAVPEPAAPGDAALPETAAIASAAVTRRLTAAAMPAPNPAIASPV